jgi:hypothetical protein
VELHIKRANLDSEELTKKTKGMMRQVDGAATKRDVREWASLSPL